MDTNELKAGAFFDHRVKDWIDFIFEKDPNSPGVINVHANRLEVPEGIGEYSTAEEMKLRSEVFTLQALLNAYRMRQLCSQDKFSQTETLVHAHAELFLSRGFAAWNLTGQARITFEDSLKRFTNPTLSTLFFENAPVCSTAETEILESSDVKNRIEQLERENINFKAVAEQGAEEMASVRDALEKAREEIHLLESNLDGAIKAGLAEKNMQLNKLQEEVDIIVATALQEYKDSEIQKRNTDTKTIESLKSYIRTLEKNQTQLESYLSLAKVALTKKTANSQKQLLERTKPRRNSKQSEENSQNDSDGESFTSNSSTYSDVSFSEEEKLPEIKQGPSQNPDAKPESPKPKKSRHSNQNCVIS